MALPRNKALFVMAGLLALAAPALAQDRINYGVNYDYLSRSDTISLSGGDASNANTAIQTPTPWPYYVNSTDIHISGVQGISALENMFKRYGTQQQSAPAADGASAGMNQ